MRLLCERTDLFYDESADEAAQVPDVRAELRAAGFTEAEQAAFLEAWDANRDALTPHQADLLFRHEEYVYPNPGVTR